LGNVQLAEKILVKFQDRLGDDVDAISQAISQSDANQLSQLAHGLKGAAANLSAESLRTVAAELEVIGRASELDRAEAALAELKVERDRFLSTVRSVLEDSFQLTTQS
jgi:HPt (histidine-containing phosphotransfer) domain-containing protein